MSYRLDLDTRQIRDNYVPRHGRSEPDPAPLPVPPPVWANEHARQVPLVGEGPTKVIPQAQSRLATTGELEALRLPTRHPQKARWWDIRFGQLGRALASWKQVQR